MNHVKFTTENWNNILKKHPKIKIDEFNGWFNKLTPKYKFIKDIKATFQKNPKGIWSAKTLPGVTLGLDVEWEHIFFVNHGIFFESFVTELENCNFDFWQKYWECLSAKENAYVKGYCKVFEHAIHDENFYKKNNVLLEKELNKVRVSLVEEDSFNVDIMDKIIGIYLSMIQLENGDIHQRLRDLTSLLNKLPEKSALYHIKMIGILPQEVSIAVEDDKLIHPKIREKVTNLRTYNYIEDKALVFDLNIRSSEEIYKKDSNSVRLVLISFMEFIGQLNLGKNSYFYELRLNHEYFQIKAMLKNSDEHELLKKLLDKLLDVLEDKEDLVGNPNTYWEEITMRHETKDTKVFEHEIKKF